MKHYRLAQQLRRTLVTMDRDYLDDRRFPPDEGGGVLVINAPDERQLTLLLERIDRSAVSVDDAADPAAARRAQAAGELRLGPRNAMTPALGLELRDSAAAAVAVDDAGGVVRTGRRRVKRRSRGGGPRGRGRRCPGGWLRPARELRPTCAEGSSPAAIIALAQAAIRRAVRAAWRDAVRHRGGCRRSVGRRGTRTRATWRFSPSPITRLRASSATARRCSAYGRRAASIAWLALNPVEREDYRKIGCLEAEVAAAGIVRRLIWRIKAGDRSRVADTVGGDLSGITADHVLNAARDGDGVSISVVRDTAKYLGMAAANLVIVSDPEMLVLGGIMATAADLLFEPVRAELARRLPRPMMDALAIAPATLGADAAAIGAARLATAALQ